MKYRDLTTEELLKVVSRTETIDQEVTPQVIADYQNGCIVQKIISIMSDQGITQKELANRIGRSKQYVSRILLEKQDFTIYSLAVFSCALDCDASIDIKPKVR